MHSMALCWLLIGIILIPSEKLVTDLRVSHDILSQKISVKDVEDDYFRASIK